MTAVNHHFREGLSHSSRNAYNVCQTLANFFFCSVAQLYLDISASCPRKDIRAFLPDILSDSHLKAGFPYWIILLSVSFISHLHFSCVSLLSARRVTFSQCLHQMWTLTAFQWFLVRFFVFFSVPLSKQGYDQATNLAQIMKRLEQIRLGIKTALQKEET